MRSNPTRGEVITAGLFGAVVFAASIIGGRATAAPAGWNLAADFTPNQNPNSA